MKITIDFDNKEIILVESVNLVEFFKKLRTIIPENEWKNYKVVSQYVNYTYTPIIIREYPTQPNIWWTTCNDPILNEGTSSAQMNTQWTHTVCNSGVYQFETTN